MSIPTLDQFSSDASTVHFNVLTIGHSQARKAAYSVRHVSNGNLNILHLGGRQHAERRFTIYIPDESELANLDASLGFTGTLQYYKGSFAAALVEYDAREWLPGENQTVVAIFVTDAD